jgi:glycosyltransferase involved in cell wall biosynthesis
VVDAVAELSRDRHPGLRLIVAGTGNHLEALREHVRRRGVVDRVTFTGLVTEEEKLRLYRRAWALVMTSPKEGWGLTCLEAEACGTPVVASDSPGLREAVRHEETGLLVPHADLPALVTALDRLLSDEGLRDRWTRGALRFAGTFSWDKCADETMDWIETTIANGERK